MARNRVHIDAAPKEVFSVLSDPDCYPEWVVGASGVRDHDENFPEVGSRFHHRIGTWTLNLKDHPEVARRRGQPQRAEGPGPYRRRLRRPAQRDDEAAKI